MGLDDIPWGPEMFDRVFGKKIGPPVWRIFFVIVVLGISAVALREIGNLFSFDSQHVSVAEKQYSRSTTAGDGSKEHPFSNAAQCPPRSDVVAFNVFLQDGTVIRHPRSSRPTCYVGNTDIQSTGPLIDKSP